LLLLSRASNPNVTPSSQGSRARDTSRDDGPQDSAAGAAHDGGVPVLETDSVVGATATSGASAGTGPVAGASSFQMQMGAAPTPPRDDDDEFEVVMERPYF
jgi:hypothetical protein